MAAGGASRAAARVPAGRQPVGRFVEQLRDHRQRDRDVRVRSGWQLSTAQRVIDRGEHMAVQKVTIPAGIGKGGGLSRRLGSRPRVSSWPMSVSHLERILDRGFTVLSPFATQFAT
jgi:hypothetical protein